MRYPILLLSALVLSLGSNAQRLFDLGLKAGVNSDDLSLDLQHRSTLGWHAGLFARVKAPLFPGIQGEVLLNSLGTDAQIDESVARIRATALRVPLFLVFSLGPAEIHAGGYMDRTLTSSTEDGMTDIGVSEPSGSSADGAYGLLVGAGLHLGRIYLGGRYNHGLEHFGEGPGFLSNASNRQFQFYLGFSLLGGGE